MRGGGGIIVIRVTGMTSSAGGVHAANPPTDKK